MTSPLLPPGIQVRDLSLRFGQQIVFDRLSFDIAGGSFVALLGASGAGKTSLLKIIAGLAQASSGTVTGSDGLPIAGRIAYMGQKDLLYPWLTVEENVALGSRLRGEVADRAWVAHLLERVGLAAHGRSLPAALSGGMRQRAAIARTLYERQPIVLMDEPCSPGGFGNIGCGLGSANPSPRSASRNTSVWRRAMSASVSPSAGA